MPTSLKVRSLEEQDNIIHVRSGIFETSNQLRKVRIRLIPKKNPSRTRIEIKSPSRCDHTHAIDGWRTRNLLLLNVSIRERAPHVGADSS